jgi:hypothetical protein
MGPACCFGLKSGRGGGGLFALAFREKRSQEFSENVKMALVRPRRGAGKSAAIKYGAIWETG